MVSASQSVPSCWCVHDDHWFLAESIRSFAASGPATVFVSQRAWNGSDGDWERCRRAAEEVGAEVIVGDWPDESLHRRQTLVEMRSRGHASLFIPDGDEIVDAGLLGALVRLAATEVADLVRVRMDTYWKDARHVIRPREEIAPALLLDARTAEHLHIRDYSCAHPLTLGPEHGVLHHLSYAGPDERIRRKISTWGHRDEVAPDWYRRVWLGWDANPTMRDLHPTHPQCYGFIERIGDVPALQGVEAFRPLAEVPEAPSRWPKVSVVIPLYGGREDLEACLVSLEGCRDLLSEVLVVDDASPDGAAEATAAFPKVRLLSNAENLGFAATCNRGYEASTGDVVLFLNSDTRVPRAGLVRLVESLLSSASIGAAGPMTNNAGYYQAVPPTYTHVDRLGLFSTDFAAREAEDVDVDMLVGFCLAVRRTAVEDTGEPPFDVRFGRGLFEDTDLCYRLQRAGYRLRLSTRAYVHHEGSKSLARMDEPPADLLHRNQALYKAKWRADLASGFASHLPGLIGPYLGPVRFDPARHADAIRRELSRLAREADVTLAMIVRNEERVLGNCLASTAGTFAQTVVVDTGSDDRTSEIAREHGAEVYEFPWTESFSEARNESLRLARGRWVFWMDADDTLPPESAVAILRAAISAPDEVCAFVVPVQFVDDGPGRGTRVDHVKLFRNDPRVRFEGRIHEQVLPSLRSLGGRVARIPEAVVLHSGYDTSEEGQSRKRARDERLLTLDLEERPDHPFVLFNLGMTAHYNGDHEAAIRWLGQSIAAASPDESHVRKAYALLGVSTRVLQGHDAAIALYDEGLASVGIDPELLFLKGVSLFETRRYEEARAAYLAMPQSSDAWFSSVDVGIYGAKRSHNLALACDACGRYLDARDVWRRSLAESPGSVHSAEALFEAALRAGDPMGMRDALSAVRAVEGTGALTARMESRLRRALDPNAKSGAPEWSADLDTAKALLESQPHLAEPMLREIEAAGSSEAAFLLGVMEIRREGYEEALKQMKSALALEPGHAQTTGQIAALEHFLSSQPSGVLPTGPHVGGLGPARIQVSIIVVTYNSAETVASCLKGALEDLGDLGELLVVDNASTDGTVDVVRDLAVNDGRVRLLRQPENLGYSRAANIGLLESKGEVLVLLNPDTTPATGWLGSLEHALSQSYAAAGPVSDNVAGDQFAGRHLPAGLRPPQKELGTWFRNAFPKVVRETRFLVGFCVAIRRETLDRLGLLDEDTRLGADDLELSWRLHLHGARIGIAMDAFVAHLGSVSFAKRDGGEIRGEIRESDLALLRKLRAWYGFGKVPPSEELWGCDILSPFLVEMGEPGFTYPAP